MWETHIIIFCYFSHYKLPYHFRDQDVTVDWNTMLDLQIIQNDYHPSVFKRGTSNRSQNPRESHFSLYGFLASRCITAGGRALLRIWCAQPTRDIQTLNKRLDDVAFFSSIQGIDSSATIRSSLKKLSGVRVCK